VSTIHQHLIGVFTLNACRNERGGHKQLLGDRVRRANVRLHLELRLRGAGLRAAVRPAARREGTLLGRGGSASPSIALRAGRLDRRALAAAPRARRGPAAPVARARVIRALLHLLRQRLRLFCYLIHPLFNPHSTLALLNTFSSHSFISILSARARNSTRCLNLSLLLPRYILLLPLPLPGLQKSWGFEYTRYPELFKPSRFPYSHSALLCSAPFAPLQQTTSQLTDLSCPFSHHTFSSCLTRFLNIPSFSPPSPLQLFVSLLDLVVHSSFIQVLNSIKCKY